MENDASILRRIIKTRRSIRRGYTGAPIPGWVLRDIVEAGVHAPSGSNTQSVRFILVTEMAEVMRISALRAGMPVGLSALIFVFAAPREGMWGALARQDSAAALMNMALMATAHGLASCWISAFQEMDATPYLRGLTWRALLPGYDWGDREPMGILAIGASENMAGDERHQGRAVARGSVESYLIRREA